MSLQLYVEWVAAQALPVWAEKVCDDTGLFWEALTLDGQPLRSADLRLRTGMRQIYVFAHAATLGLAPAGPSIALAQRMMDRLRSIAWAPDGRKGWVARFDRSGTVLDSRHDLYDHAFVLHALGYLYQATRDERYRTWIDETLHVIDEGMAGLHGGWAESTMGELPRRQNPHMHFFEANLALYETTGEARHLARAGELFGLFRSRFIDQNTGVLREFFGPQWQVDAAYRSERLDPGHMMEWVWLLRRFERSTGRYVSGHCSALMQTALAIGRHESGFLIDEVDISGQPLSDSRRLWPQTEYLKALLVQSTATGRPDLLDEADALVQSLLGTYLGGPVKGCWQDQFRLDGTLSATTIPASSLYHLIVPAAEILLARAAPQR
ncbi:AGE family epimerase/isomerase [Lichenihabitans psoromatis]|uniref:AGE family epimerase/isomerase n=1 Tax=Lichenihabitans psoromatis TaxID=2528642 RepID=UPI0010356FD6|nr:AGE family epimerase/isomerase [Lichenihabitans psoromatis]